MEAFSSEEQETSSKLKSSVSLKSQHMKSLKTAKEICIYADSLAALKAILRCTRGELIKIKWIPGQRGVEGNERAVELAKHGSPTLL